ncbi:MAG: endonuclease V [Candidatus Methanomethylicaceae archaeon]
MIFDVRRAIEAQKRLAGMVREERLSRDPETICGMDVAYTGTRGFGSAVVMTYPELEVLEIETAEAKVRVPYIPSLLAFREMPVLFKLFKKLRIRSEVFMLDGHGVLHPRRCGLASHFGVVFDVATVGVAKEMLSLEGSEVVGDTIRVNGEILGRIVRRVYVSVGNRITLEDSVRIVSGCMRGHRVPEPLFLAHRISDEGARRVGLGK